MTGVGGEGPGLERFVAAQAGTYEAALSELRAGRKSTHWMWFIFPQLRGLGRSAMAERYGVSSLGEARRYLEHEVLGPRLLECTGAVLAVEGRTAAQIFGYPDDRKFHSSMTLFDRAGPGNGEFGAALAKYFEGRPDPLTVGLLEER